MGLPKVLQDKLDKRLDFKLDLLLHAQTMTTTTRFTSWSSSPSIFICRTNSVETSGANCSRGRGDICEHSFHNFDEPLAISEAIPPASFASGQSTDLLLTLFIQLVRVSRECWKRGTEPCLERSSQFCCLSCRSMLGSYQRWWLSLSRMYLVKNFEQNASRYFLLGCLKLIRSVVRYHGGHAHDFNRKQERYKWHFWVQAIPVSHASTLSFCNDKHLRQEHFPFVLEDTRGLQDLCWSGHAAHLKQLEILNRISLSHLTRMSVSSSCGEHDSCFASIRLGTTLGRDGALVNLCNLRELNIRNCSATASGLLSCLLPLVK